MNTIKIKIKAPTGHQYIGKFFKYIGNSKVDGYPLYSYERCPGEPINWSYHLSHFIINGRPGYTPTWSDIEYIDSLDSTLLQEDVICLLPPPSTKLYYLDYEYCDKRLLLLL